MKQTGEVTKQITGQQGRGSGVQMHWGTNCDINKNHVLKPTPRQDRSAHGKEKRISHVLKLKKKVTNKLTERKPCTHNMEHECWDPATGPQL